ncbi:MAG: hypothetical protein COB90_00740 [Hyphomicrobiales bacterium]|nr:MAG: hypothetical protein COB90_00740 [Hyphomicrobiales bacterium]
MNEILMKSAEEHLIRQTLLPHVELRTSRRTFAHYHTHTHDEFSFGVVDKGSSKYINQRQIARIYPGQHVTINPGEAHSCNPESGPWSYRMVYIDAGWIGNWQQQAGVSASNADYQHFVKPVFLIRKWPGDLIVLLPIWKVEQVSWRPSVLLVIAWRGILASMEIWRLMKQHFHQDHPNSIVFMI